MDEASVSLDVRRTARLFFARELREGVVSERDLTSRPEVVSALRSRPVPNAGIRVVQRLAMKAGRLDYENGFLADVRRARRAVLGPLAEAPPRFLIRVDEFPDSSALDHAPDRWRVASRQFHETLREAGVPYLMAIVPQYTHAPLDPKATGGRPLTDEDAVFIEQMGREGVTFAQHGATHRTRRSDSRRRSELCGLDAHSTEALIAQGRQRLADVGIEPRIFVPPFNRFDATQFDQLARHFDVIGGGPESVPLLGFHGGPTWRGDAVFLPCYQPLYARAAELPTVVERLVARGVGEWVPIVLHLSWELGDRFRSLAMFARAVAAHASSWTCLLDEVDATRTPSSADALPGTGTG